MNAAEQKKLLQDFLNGFFEQHRQEYDAGNLLAVEDELQSWRPEENPQLPESIRSRLPLEALERIGLAGSEPTSSPKKGTGQHLMAPGPTSSDEELLSLATSLRDELAVARARQDGPEVNRLEMAVLDTQSQIRQRVDQLFRQASDASLQIDARLALLERVLTLDPNHALAQQQRSLLVAIAESRETFRPKLETILAMGRTLQQGGTLDPDAVEDLYAERSGELGRRIAAEPEVKAAWDQVCKWRDTAWSKGSVLHSSFLADMEKGYRQLLDESWQGRQVYQGRWMEWGEAVRNMAVEWGEHIYGRIQQDLDRSASIADPEAQLKALQTASARWDQWYEATNPGDRMEERFRKLKAALDQATEQATNLQSAWQHHLTLMQQAAAANTNLERLTLYEQAKREWLAASGKSYASLDDVLQHTAENLAEELARELRPQVIELGERISHCTDLRTLESLQQTLQQHSLRSMVRPVTSGNLERVRSDLDVLRTRLARQETLVLALQDIDTQLQGEAFGADALRARIEQLQVQFDCKLPTWINRIVARQGLDEQLLAARTHLDNLDAENCLAALAKAPAGNAEVKRVKQRAYLVRGLTFSEHAETWKPARHFLRLASESIEPEVRDQATRALEDLSLSESRQRPIDQIVSQVREELKIRPDKAPEGDNVRFSQAVAALDKALTMDGNLDDARGLLARLLTAWEDRLRLTLSEWIRASEANRVGKAGEVRTALSYIQRDPRLLAGSAADRALVDTARLSELRFSAMTADFSASNEEMRTHIANIESILQQDMSLLNDFDLLERLVRFCILVEDYHRVRSHFLQMQECLTAKAFAGASSSDQQELNSRLEKVRRLLSTSEEISKLLPSPMQVQSKTIQGEALAACAEQCKQVWDKAGNETLIKATLISRLADYTENVCGELALEAENQLKAGAPQTGTFVIFSLARDLATRGAAGVAPRLDALWLRLKDWRKLVLQNWLADVQGYQEACRQSVTRDEAEPRGRTLLFQGEYLANLLIAGGNAESDLQVDDTRDPQELLQWLRESQNLLGQCGKILTDLTQACDQVLSLGNPDIPADRAFASCQRLLSDAQTRLNVFHRDHARAPLHLRDLESWDQRLYHNLGREMTWPTGDWPADEQGWQDLRTTSGRKGEIAYYDLLRKGYQMIVAQWQVEAFDVVFAASEPMSQKIDPSDHYGFRRNLAVTAIRSAGGEQGTGESRIQLVGLDKILEYTAKEIIPNLREWEEREKRIKRLLEARTACDDSSLSLEDRLRSVFGITDGLRQLYGFPYSNEVQKSRQERVSYLDAVAARIGGKEPGAGNGREESENGDGDSDPPEDGNVERMDLWETDNTSPVLPQRKRRSMFEARRILFISLQMEPIPDCLSVRARDVSRMLYSTSLIRGSNQGATRKRDQAENKYQQHNAEIKILLDALGKKWRLFADFDARPDRPPVAVRNHVMPIQEELGDLDRGDPASSEILDLPLPYSLWECIKRLLGLTVD